MAELEQPEQIEELTFAPPTSEEYVVLNPDIFVRGLVHPESPVARQLRLFVNQKRQRQIRAKKRKFLCESCLTGLHKKCSENGCPCVHRKITEGD